MAGIHCFDAASRFVIGKSVTLNKAESQHVVKVMRLREGGKVTLLNGLGSKAQGVLEVADVKAAKVAVVAVETVAAPACSIHLAQVIPKGKSMDSLVRKATEIGVRYIYPLISEHSDVRLNGERGQSKRAGWSVTAMEACKQCGCPFLPEIYAPQLLSDFFAQLARLSHQPSTTSPRDEVGEKTGLALEHASWLFIASLEADAGYLRDYHSILAPNPRHALWLIGPEGDFSIREYAQARDAGCLPVRLAQNVLRSETAATYALSILDYELELQQRTL